MFVDRQFAFLIGFALMWFLVQPIQAAEPPEKIDPAAGCITAQCHGDLKTPSYLHGPVNMEQCEPCHVAKGNRHLFEERPETPELCAHCHDIEKPVKEVVHSPFEIDCAMCHDPHGADNRYLVMGGSGAEGCQNCHGDMSAEFDIVHGPVEMGECLGCHSPHQSDHQYLLTEAQPDLCTSCHTDLGEGLDEAVSMHPPVMDECTSCHVPHGGANEYLLAETGVALCQQCHEDFLEEVARFKVPHQPILEGKACVNCHQPHISHQETLLRSELQPLCLSCHDKPIEHGKREIGNIAAQLKDAESLHGPLKEGDCGACHQAHGSNFPDILRDAFPTAFYVPYKDDAYPLCFDCHDKRLVTDETSEHTDFRNGGENMHKLHVDDPRGRSCRVCHREHASMQPELIRDSVLLGKWKMPVKFTKTETGGGCTTGCHFNYRYDRDNPVVDNKPPGA